MTSIREITLGKSGKVALVDAEDYEYLMQWKWNCRNDYACRYTYRKGKATSILLHRFLMNCPKDKIIDHKNGNRLDNRRCNLRICTYAENSKNSVKPINNTSGYKGVSWDKDRQKWEVYLHVKDRKIRVGRHTDLIEAAKLYDQKAKELFGEFARLNFPQEVQP